MSDEDEDEKEEEEEEEQAEEEEEEDDDVVIIPNPHPLASVPARARRAARRVNYREWSDVEIAEQLVRDQPTPDPEPEVPVLRFEDEPADVPLVRTNFGMASPRFVAMIEREEEAQRRAARQPRVGRRCLEAPRKRKLTRKKPQNPDA